MRNEKDENNETFVINVSILRKLWKYTNSTYVDKYLYPFLSLKQTKEVSDLLLY